MKPCLSGKFFRKLTSVLLILYLLFGQYTHASASVERDDYLQYLQSIVEMVHDQYMGEIRDEQLTMGAVRGLINSLDDYTIYYTPGEAKAFMEGVAGAFGGIGISMEVKGDYIVVSEVFPSSPAEKAGILQGDRLVEADGKNLVKAAADTAASLIRGEEGTEVLLGVLRTGMETVKHYRVVRETVKVNPVIYEIRNGIGYIRLKSFNENADEYLGRALSEMDKKKITKIILDLRGNPGGDVGQAVAVARRFVPEGLITRLDYKSEMYTDIEYYSDMKKTKYKLAILVNETSASASEIVAGAVQDSGAGKLVGKRTYGKAKFQGLLPLLTPEAYFRYKQQFGISAVNTYDLLRHGIIPTEDDIGGYTKMTLGFYYTPKGRLIDGIGLKPDISAENTSLIAGIDINEIRKLTKTAKPRLGGYGNDICNAEKILRILGYEVEEPDILLDAGTVEALKKYQKDSGIKVSGVMEYRTQDALNADLQSLIIKYDRQYTAAVKLLN